VSRKNYTVGMQELASWQWYYLQALLAGADHPGAVKAAAEKSNSPEEDVSADLLLWLPVAIDAGYVYRFVVNAFPVTSLSPASR
jgi:hypothetical protein